MISQIAALSTNHVIGKDNTLPWHYPEDLQHFKKITTGKTIIMGRKTYESIGRPLPKRENIVLTRNTHRTAPGVEVIHSIDAIIKTYTQIEDELMIIGGEQIYNLFLPYTDKLYLTQVHTVIDGDAFYPPYKDAFTEIARVKKDDYDFVEYEKNPLA